MPNISDIVPNEKGKGGEDSEISESVESKPVESKPKEGKRQLAGRGSKHKQTKPEKSIDAVCTSLVHCSEGEMKR